MANDMNIPATMHRKPIRVQTVVRLIVASLMLVGCGTPSAISLRNLTDATAAPPTSVPQKTATDDMPGMAMATPVVGTQVANTDKPVASSTDYVLIWILFGTPTPTSSVHQSAAQPAQVSATSVRATSTLTPVKTSAPVATRPTLTAVPLTLTNAADNEPAAKGLPGDPARGKIIFTTIGGCTACHDVTSGTTLVGPSLKGVAGRAGGRKPGMSASDYLHESILKPNAYLVQGFQSGIMLQNLGQVLTPQQINDVVAYLMTLN